MPSGVSGWFARRYAQTDRVVRLAPVRSGKAKGDCVRVRRASRHQRRQLVHGPGQNDSWSTGRFGQTREHPTSCRTSNRRMSTGSIISTSAGTEDRTQRSVARSGERSVIDHDVHLSVSPSRRRVVPTTPRTARRRSARTACLRESVVRSLQSGGRSIVTREAAVVAAVCRLCVTPRCPTGRTGRTCRSAPHLDVQGRDRLLCKRLRWFSSGNDDSFANEYPHC